MRTFIITITVILITIAVLFAAPLSKIKHRKQKQTRELYALMCTFLLCDVLLLMLAIFLPYIGIWDSIVNQIVPRGLQFWFKTATFLTVLVVIGIALARLVKSHAEWDGAVSIRQARLDARSNLNDGYLRRIVVFISDALLWLSYKEHEKELELFVDSDTPWEYSAVQSDEMPWRAEFAAIYNIVNSRASVSVERDWHSEGQCFIAPYNNAHIAVLISDDIPAKPIVDRFLAYIHKFDYHYYSIVIAIKNNAENVADKVIAKTEKGVDVEIRFKNNLLDGLVDFSGYFDSIKKELQNPITQSSNLSTADVYTPLDCKNNSDGKICAIDDYIDRWLAEESNRQLAIFGDFGQGKTVTALKLTERLTNTSYGRVPIFIKLRGKSPRNSNSFEILSYFASQYGLNPHALQILNNNGRLLVILDGFDEMDYVGDWSIRRRHFRSIWQLASKNAKIILTGRGNYFSDIQEEISALGNDINNNDVRHCDKITLCMFTPDKILEALRNVDEAARNGIAKILRSNPSPQFLDLISRPSQLFLITQIWKSRKMSEKYQHLTHACIIDEFLQGNFERQFVKANEATYAVLSPLEREYFMMGIALKMYSAQTTEMDLDMLNETVKELVSAFPDSISKTNHAILDVRNGKTIGSYYWEDPRTRDAIFTDIRTCGLLIRDEARDKFVFAHKSFMDLLVAKCFYSKVLPNNDNYNVISRALFRCVKIRNLRRNDLTGKRLQAELVMHYVSEISKRKSTRMSVEAQFEQCYRLIVGKFTRNVTPLSAFKKYSYRMEKAFKYITPEDSRYDKAQTSVSKGEVARSMVLPALFLPITIVMFAVKSIQLTFTYRAQAWEDMQTFGFSPVSALPLSTILQWLLIGLGAVTIISYVWTVLAKKYQYTKYTLRVETAFLTWYYACLNEGHSEDEIRSCFPQELGRRFVLFISELVD